MKCRATRKAWLWGMLVVGAALLLAGMVWVKVIGVEEGLSSRMAGFLSGLGGSLAAMGGGFLLLGRIRGEQRTRESKLHMEDERGLMVAYKAQNVAAIYAVLAIIAILIVALVRGDGLYMALGTAACTTVALVKMAAWYIYDKRM